MKATLHKFSGSCLLPGLISARFCSVPGFENLYGKIYTATLLNCGLPVFFENQQEANDADHSISVTKGTISETKSYFIKKSLCH
jgi:hypothetical protein